MSIVMKYDASMKEINGIREIIGSKNGYNSRLIKLVTDKGIRNVLGIIGENFPYEEFKDLPCVDIVIPGRVETSGYVNYFSNKEIERLNQIETMERLNLLPKDNKEIYMP